MIVETRRASGRPVAKSNGMEQWHGSCVSSDSAGRHASFVDNDTCVGGGGMFHFKEALLRNLALSVVAVVTLCAASFASTPSRSAELMTMKLGVLKLGATANVWAATRNGIFKKHGLDVTIVEVPITSQAVSVLQSKSVDVMLQIPGTMMVAKERGFDLALVGQNETAGVTPPVSNAILVQVNSPIKTVAELKGKKVATASPRGQSWAAILELFQKNGISAKEVQITEAPFPSHADLLRTGGVDAVVALDPFTTQIIKSGYGRPLSWYLIETVSDQPVGSWWALRSWALEHKETIKAFQAAVKESHELFNGNPELARKAVADFSGLKPELVRDMPPISWKSTIDTEVWQQVLDMMTRQGELTESHKASEYFEFIDSSILK